MVPASGNRSRPPRLSTLQPWSKAESIKEAASEIERVKLQKKIDTTQFGTIAFQSEIQRTAEKLAKENMALALI